jgi:hypothetical protein
MPEPRSSIVTLQKHYVSQLAVWVLSILGTGALAVGLGWIMVAFTVEIANTFEIIAEIVSWIIWPLRI